MRNCTILLLLVVLVVAAATPRGLEDRALSKKDQCFIDCSAHNIQTWMQTRFRHGCGSLCDKILAKGTPSHPSGHETCEQECGPTDDVCYRKCVKCQIGKASYKYEMSQLKEHSQAMLIWHVQPCINWHVSHQGWCISNSLRITSVMELQRNFKTNEYSACLIFLSNVILSLHKMIF